MALLNVDPFLDLCDEVRDRRISNRNGIESKSMREAPNPVLGQDELDVSVRLKRLRVGPPAGKPDFYVADSPSDVEQSDQVENELVRFRKRVGADAHGRVRPAVEIQRRLAPFRDTSAV